MTREELAQYDGRDGRKAYVAVDDVIYDLTDSPRWQNGEHEGTHQAGQDLTQALRQARHVRAVLKNFPRVGYLDNEPGLSPQTARKANQLIFLFFLMIAALGAYLLLR
ncbi:MAG: cytochrome b5 domain-containing protein [Desulfuromonadaceae bacterium]